MAGQLDFYCLASDFEWTQLWSVDPEDGRFTPVGSLPGDYWQAYSTGDGRLVLSGVGDPLALVDPAAARASMIGEQIDTGSPFGVDGEGLEGPGRWLFEAAMARQGGAFLGFSTLAVRPGHLAVAVQNRDKTRVDIYRLLDVGPESHQLAPLPRER